MDISFERLKIEVVSENDEQKVLSIRKPEDVYEGHDYLPDTFRRLIGFPNSTGYAVVDGDNFLAFTLVSVFDDGQTCVLRAVRIAQEYEGKGIIKWFIAKIKEMLKVTTNVKYMVSSDLTESVDTARRVKEGRCYTVVDREMVHYGNEIEVEQLKEILKQHENNLHDIDVIDEGALSKILESGYLTDSNYKKKLVVNWVPFRPIKSNAAFIMQETTLVIGSNLENADRHLITFGNRYEAFVGTVIFIDIYGHVSSNLKSHIMFHLKQVLKCFGGRHVTLTLFYDFNISFSVENMMKDIGFIPKETEEKGCWCVETGI